MPAIAPDELALLRTDWDAGLTDTVTIQRNVPTRTASGGTRDDWSTVAYSGPGKLLPSKPGLGGGSTLERDAAGRLVSIQPWTCNLPHGTACTHADRIVVGGRVFEVLAVATWESNEVGRVATCVEVRS